MEPDEQARELNPEERTGKEISEGKLATAPPFPVAGIGASAGGLEALRTFLKATPPDTGMAFVIVVHLSPQHQSHLAELLQAHTEMPVTQVTELVKMEPNHVYVIPPNRNLSSIDTHLRLSALEEARRERAPIDHFFRTLARTHDGRAIGIVLSGGGSDGAVGLKAIKEAGGLILAQDPKEATYDSMPQSAIAAGVVDQVLPVAEMAGRLLTYLTLQPMVAPLAHEEADSEAAIQVTALLQKIFARLRSVTGHDFSRYKKGTVGRRLARRMALRGVTSQERYLELLRADPDEVHALFRELLIVVTSFFREPETFEVLAREVIPKLLEGQGANGEVRIWVPGCATGEEAYSLAILLLEQAAQMDHPPALQIFATDLSAEGLAVAREGVYPSAIAADIPPELLDRYFVRENGAYRIRQEVRERVLFAQHSLLKDPPFSHVDLISCRNLLIYLQRDVQRQVLELFHYALNPDGYLFLGASESIDERDLFHAVDAHHSIYRRQSMTKSVPRLPSMPLSLIGEAADVEAAAHRRPQPIGASYGRLHQQLAERHAPPSLLVDADHRVIHVSERAGRYLQIGGGELTDNVLRLVRDELQAELATLIYRTFHRGKSRRSDPIAVNIEGRARAVTLYVEPAPHWAERGTPSPMGGTEGGGFALIYFLESDAADAGRAMAVADEKQNSIIQDLEAELAATKAELRSALEEFETSKEEMKASNEELQSINEELRSITEELETSKEELQSMNEELVAVNDENKQKVEELRQLTADLQNLMTATDIATLFLDRKLQIQRFTPAASELFHIRHSDRGRPLGHLAHRLASYNGLLDDAGQVLKTLMPVEQEVTGDDGHHYFLRIRPYRTAQDQIDGVVITLVDITRLWQAEMALRESEKALRRSEARLRQIFEIVTVGIIYLDESGTITAANDTFLQQVGYTRDDLKAGQLSWQKLTPPEWMDLSRQQMQQLAETSRIGPYEKEYLCQDGSRCWFLFAGVQVSPGDIVEFVIDISEQKAAEQALRQSQQGLTSLAAELEERVKARTEQVRRLASELVAAEQTVRHRIAQNLHDDLQQMLYAAAMQLQFIRESPGGKEELDELDKMIAASVSLTRQLTMELSPPVLPKEGLPEALAWLASHMDEMHGLQVRLETGQHLWVTSEEQRVLLSQIVRELLFNVVKHAGVEEALVALEETDEGLTITVSDQGRGFDVEQALANRNSGFGLPSVRERVELFGGRVNIDSRPEAGTRVTLFLPNTVLDPAPQNPPET